MSADNEDIEGDADTGFDFEISFSIRITDDEGEGIEGLTVSVWYKGLFDPWYPDKAETNEDGWAQLEKSAPVRKTMDGGIEIDIKVKGILLAEDLRVENGDAFSYTLHDE